MKSRDYSKDNDAKRLMGMSGIEVYRVRNSPNPKEWYYDVVWRGRPRWSVVEPWETEKYVLREVGLKLRNWAIMEEEFEKSLKQSEELKAAQEKEDADTHEVMTLDVMRTVDDKPLYFY
jgi:hypothetical protein